VQIAFSYKMKDNNKLKKGGKFGKNMIQTGRMA
jgi:hypothetical protein